ncbi:MAG: CoA pyrophosphatase [Myxococcota bacterium]|nr:CoA pyrophosphatase [Myxococcota bacterium]
MARRSESSQAFRVSFTKGFREMNADWSSNLRERLGRVIDSPRLVVERPDLRRAAVLVPLVLGGEEPQLIFTLRTLTVATHKGQVSFPGGQVEPNDGGPVETALRESQEEIGLEPRFVEVLGLLDDFATSTSFLITPVLGIVDPVAKLKRDEREVASIFQEPLSAFLDPAKHELVTVEHEGACHRFHRYTTSHNIIWGATAGILYRLLMALSAIKE